jgi:hypothetical protein
MVSQMGLTLHMMIDSETELYSILGADKTIRYFYRLVNLPFQKISAEDIEKIKPKMVNFNCTTPETKNGVLKRGIKMRYSYYDKDKVHIAYIEVRRALERYAICFGSVIDLGLMQKSRRSVGRPSASQAGTQPAASQGNRTLYGRVR